MQSFVRACAVVFYALIASTVFAAPIEPSDIRVIDGDTIRVHHKQPDVRLIDFNAPETRRAQCSA